MEFENVKTAPGHRLLGQSVENARVRAYPSSHKVLQLGFCKDACKRQETNLNMRHCNVNDMSNTHTSDTLIVLRRC